MGSIHKRGNEGSANMLKSFQLFSYASTKVATLTTIAVVSGLLATTSAQAAPIAPKEVALEATLVATPSAPFIDDNAGTSVSVAITDMKGVTDQDVLYLALLDNSLNVTSRVTVLPGRADASGNVTTGSASFKISTSGILNYRLWVDKEDPKTGIRNRSWDNSELLNEPTKRDSFKFAGNPHSVDLFDVSGKALEPFVSVNEGTCKVFKANVKDSAGTPVRDQQLQISFEEGAAGSRPQACTASELDSVNFTAVSTSNAAGILSGNTDVNGNVSFAIKGAKGTPAWTGSVYVNVVDPKADVEATQTFNLSTNAGGNNAVAKINAVAPATASRLSSTKVTVTAADKYGQPLQGVILALNSEAKPAVITSLNATDMNGAATFAVDTSVLGKQTLNVWANKSVAGSTNALDPGEISTQIKIEIVPQVVDISKSTFRTSKTTLPVDLATNDLTLAINDKDGNPVQDVQIDFSVTKGSNITLSTSAGTTDGKGLVTITASRLASIKTRDSIEVTASVRNSNPLVSIVAKYEIQPRAASKIALVSTPKVTTVDGGATRVEVVLQDQFGGPFAGTVNFRSTAGRNYSEKGVQQVTTDATGRAVVNFADVKGADKIETDSIVAEALTVDKVTIASDPVNVFYSPSLTANKLTQIGLPDSYNVLYADATEQTAYKVTVKVQNSTDDVDRNLYAQPAKVTLSGPGKLSGNVDKLELLSNDSAELVFNVQPSGVAGTITLSVAIGSVTKSWAFKVLSDAAGARNIKLVSSKTESKAGASTRFTATVTDVFGNKLSGVWVTFKNIGVGRLNLAGVRPCGMGTSDSNYADMALTDSTGQVWIDLLTSTFDAGDGKVAAYLGWPFQSGCISYPEAEKAAGIPFAGATAGNSSDSAVVAYSLDTSAADKLAAAQAAAAQAAADKASAQALATQAAADKAAAQALASQAAADKAAAQALASQSNADKAAAQTAADRAAADKASAQALASQAAADKAAAQALASQAAADKAAAQALASQAAADKAAAQALASQSNADKAAAQTAADRAAADKASAQALASQAAADKAAAQALATQAATDKAAAQSTATQIAKLQAAIKKLIANSKGKAIKALYARSLSIPKVKR